MSYLDIAFSREVLRAVMADVRAALPDGVKPSDAWVYCLDDRRRDHWEFHFDTIAPFYWHGRADNAYDARAKGWNAWLAAQGVEGYTNG